MASPAQRVWMAVYYAEDERRLRLHLPEFETASTEAGHEWALIDITDAFETWMAAHEYRDAYFEEPEADPAGARWVSRLARGTGARAAPRDHRARRTRSSGSRRRHACFGLGDRVKVSALDRPDRGSRRRSPACVLPR